jgi:serine/threonine protein kinase
MRALARATGPAKRHQAAQRCAAWSATATLERVSELLDRVLADKYRLDAELGRGGMGIVFRGEHLVTGRPIAIKVLRAELAEDRTLGRRFLREVKAAASLVHPNVVGVLDFGIEQDGTAFQVLELLEGESLAERLSRGKLSPERALELLLPILHAIDAAHARGVVHRDLKPDNVFLAKNAHGRVVPKLLDFGIAKVREPEREEGARPKDTHTTQLGTVIGTPAYMSPEQARGGEVGAPTDIWAMAVVLFECLSGRVPFEDENASILMAKVMLERAPSLVLVAPDVPRALALVIDSGLEADPEARPASMALFRRALRAAAKEAGIAVAPEGASDCADEGPPSGTGPRGSSAPPREAEPLGPAATLGPSAAVTKIAKRASPAPREVEPARSEPPVSRTPSLAPSAVPSALRTASTVPSSTVPSSTVPSSTVPSSIVPSSTLGRSLAIGVALLVMLGLGVAMVASSSSSDTAPDPEPGTGAESVTSAGAVSGTAPEPPTEPAIEPEPATEPTPPPTLAIEPPSAPAGSLAAVAPEETPHEEARPLGPRRSHPAAPSPTGEPAAEPRVDPREPPETGRTGLPSLRDWEY